MTSFSVNGRPVSVDVDPDTPLLWVLRDELELTGTKFGCGIAQCGACTVHLDGLPRRSCVTPIAAVEGARGHHDRGHLRARGASRAARLGRARRAAVRLLPVGADHDARSRCCSEIPKPTDADIDGAMAGNICRCATYVRIRAAIHDAAATLEG